MDWSTFFTILIQVILSFVVIATIGFITAGIVRAIRSGDSK